MTRINGAAVTYTADQQISTALGTSFHYDPIGNLTSAASNTFTFDAADRMHRQDGGGTTTRYLYDGGQLVGEYVNSFTTLARRHIPGLGLDDIVLTWDGTGTGAPSFLLQDERGSIVGQANGAGVVTVNAYDDYGQPAPANTGAFGYTGQMNLPVPGLQHYRMRAYESRLGRFLQTDPIGYAGGANLYGYVGEDPVNRIDPWGLSSELGGVTVTGQRPCPIVTNAVTICRPEELTDLQRFMDMVERTIWGSNRRHERLARARLARAHADRYNCTRSNLDTIFQNRGVPEATGIALTQTSQRGGEVGFWVSVSSDGSTRISPFSYGIAGHGQVTPGPRPEGDFTLQAFVHTHINSLGSSAGDQQSADGVDKPWGPSNIVAVHPGGVGYRCPR